MRFSSVYFAIACFSATLYIRVGTAQPDSLNITLSCNQREKIVYARNASRVTDRQTEIRFKSNKLSFSGGLVGYFIILVLGRDMSLVPWKPWPILDLLPCFTIFPIYRRFVSYQTDSRLNLNLPILFVS